MTNQIARVLLFLTCLAAAGCAEPVAEAPPGAVAADPLDGVWDYVSPLKGTAVFQEGHFVYLFGTRDTDSLMTSGSAGTYRIRGDTVTNTFEYHILPGRVGRSFSYLFQVVGDTFVYRVLVDSAGATMVTDDGLPPAGAVMGIRATAVRRR